MKWCEPEMGGLVNINACLQQKTCCGDMTVAGNSTQGEAAGANTVVQ
jgi:hypothetical protein